MLINVLIFSSPHPPTSRRRFEVHTLWVFDVLLIFLLVGDQLDVCPLLLILTGLSYIELFISFKNSISKSFLAAARNVEFFAIYGASQRDCWKAMHPVRINHPHALLEGEAQVDLLHKAADLRKQVWNQFYGVNRARPFVVCAQL